MLPQNPLDDTSQGPSLLQSSMNAKAKFCPKPWRPGRINSAILHKRRLHAQRIGRHVGASHHIQFPGQSRLDLAVCRGRRQPAHQGQAQHRRSEHQQAPTPTSAWDEVRPELCVNEVICPQGLREMGLGNAKHHFLPFLVLLVGNPLFLTTRFKPADVVSLTKHKPVIAGVPRVCIVIDPALASHRGFVREVVAPPCRRATASQPNGQRCDSGHARLGYRRTSIP